MIQIVSAQTGNPFQQFVTLAQEYVQWMIGEISAHYPNFDVDTFAFSHQYDDISRKYPGGHMPPDGCLLIATSADRACGSVAIGRIDESVCELRTLFVRPEFRGAGIGKRLAIAALDEAKALGYRYARLDTLGFMEGAQALYRSLGFYSIEPYGDVTETLKPYLCYFELKL